MGATYTHPNPLPHPLSTPITVQINTSTDTTRITTTLPRMTNRPPSPPSPVSAPTATTLPVNSSDESRVLVTTPQVRTWLEKCFGYHPDEDSLETILVELDRREYVECVTITRTGDYVWDLTDSPDRIADVVADAVVTSIHSWLEGETASDR